MTIGDQKVQRTLRKQKVRGLLQDKKVPGTNSGTRAATAPGPPMQGLPQDSWERAGLEVPSAGILRSREKEGAYTLCNSMDGTGEH